MGPSGPSVPCDTDSDCPSGSKCDLSANQCESDGSGGQRVKAAVVLVVSRQGGAAGTGGEAGTGGAAGTGGSAGQGGAAGTGGEAVKAVRQAPVVQRDKAAWAAV